ncbi:MAG TPA: hypothetical protein PLP17_02880 [Oligoflexia bacterium]|nr:hypothetical protein [Oligoflexia bacterium]
MGRKKTEISPYALAADAVGLTFFLAATAIVILGETTSLLSSMGLEHPGVKFVYTYMCPIISTMILSLFGSKTMDLVGTLLVAECVILVTAIIYRWICYLGLRLISLLMV